MSQQIITVWRREDRDTTPRGFGNPPTYSLDKPYTSDWDMIWAEPITCTLPDGYTIAECVSGTMELYNPDNQREEIVDDHGHPAIVTGMGVNSAGKTFTRYQRLDK